MKIIQTFWTQPGLKANWIDPVYHYMSWALSCLQLREFYDEVELYTDDLGYKLLVEQFELPYTRVHLTLNDFQYPSYLWSAPKLKTYSLQEEPFLHVDGDVFLYKAISEDFVSNNDIVFQNLEIDEDYGFYADILKDYFAIKCQEGYSDWLGSISLDRIAAFNAGIMGGRNVSFFKEYTSAAFSFLQQQEQIIAQLRSPQFGTHLAEQVLPAMLIQNQQLQIGTLFQPDFNPGLVSGQKSSIVLNDNHLSKVELPFSYMNFDAFGISPYGRKYIHIVGDRKKSMIICKQISRRLMKAYPAHYRLITDFSNNYQKSKSYNQSINEKDKDENKGFEIKLEGLSFRNIYPRTCKMLSLYKMDLDLDLINIKHFESSILERIKALNQQDEEKVKDILCLESTKFNFAKLLTDDDLDAMDKDSCSCLDVLNDITQLSGKNLFFQTNPLIRIIHTKWNWFDTRIFSDPEHPEESKIILILPDKISYSFVEFILTPFQNNILENFKVRRHITDVASIYPFDSVFFNNLVYLQSNGLLLSTIIKKDLPSFC